MKVKALILYVLWKRVLEKQLMKILRIVENLCNSPEAIVIFLIDTEENVSQDLSWKSSDYECHIKNEFKVKVDICLHDNQCFLARE